MSFKNWLFTEELFPNKTATVFHRTTDLGKIEKMLESGFKPGGGCMYGCGLYTTFDLKSQFYSGMTVYGQYIVKFKVENLMDYIITPISVAKYVLKDKYRISDQLKRFGEKLLGRSPVTGDSLPMRTTDSLAEYDKLQAESQYSSDLAKRLYYDNKVWIEKSAGIIYNGRQDGYCLVKYQPTNEGVTMLGYAHAPVSDLSQYKTLNANKGWTTNSRGGKIKSLYGTKPDPTIKVGDKVYMKDEKGNISPTLPELEVLSIDGNSAYVKGELISGQVSLSQLTLPNQKTADRYKLSRSPFEEELEKVVKENRLKLFLIRSNVTDENVIYILKRYPSAQLAKTTIETIAKRKPQLITQPLIRELDNSGYNTYSLIKIILEEIKDPHMELVLEIVKTTANLRSNERISLLKLMTEKIPKLTKIEKQEILYVSSGLGTSSKDILPKQFNLELAVDMIDHMGENGHFENVTVGWIVSLFVDSVRSRNKPLQENINKNVIELTKAFLRNTKMSDKDTAYLILSVKIQTERDDEYISTIVDYLKSIERESAATAVEKGMAKRLQLAQQD
jgi:hypothetical protein